MDSEASSQLSHDYISGVSSSSALKSISKIRKNLEFLVESLEEVERSYFTINNHNFLHVSKEYEFLIDSFGLEFDKNHRIWILKMLEFELIKPLANLTKNKEEFEISVYYSLQKLAKKFGFSLEEQGVYYNSSSFINLRSGNTSNNISSGDTFGGKKEEGQRFEFNFEQFKKKNTDIFKVEESYDTEKLINCSIRKRAMEMLKNQELKFNDQNRENADDTMNLEKVQSTREYGKMNFSKFDSDEIGEVSCSPIYSNIFTSREVDSGATDPIEGLKQGETESESRDKSNFFSNLF